MTHALKPSQVVGRRLKRLRGGVSAQRIAERCAELGRPELNRSVIANIESGRREEVSVEELFVLGAALNVSPLLLCIPLGDNDRVAVTPKIKIHPHLVLDWVQGEAPLTNTNRTARVQPWKDEGTPDWRESAQPIFMFGMLRSLQDRVGHLDGVRKAAAKASSTEAHEQAERQFREALRDLAQHRTYMERAGIEPPQLPVGWMLALAEDEAVRRAAEREGGK